MWVVAFKFLYASSNLAPNWAKSPNILYIMSHLSVKCVWWTILSRRFALGIKHNIFCNVPASAAGFKIIFLLSTSIPGTSSILVAAVVDIESTRILPVGSTRSLPLWSRFNGWKVIPWLFAILAISAKSFAFFVTGSFPPSVWHWKSASPILDSIIVMIFPLAHVEESASTSRSSPYAVLLRASLDNLKYFFMAAALSKNLKENCTALV